MKIKIKTLILITFSIFANQMLAQKYQVKGVLYDKDLKETIAHAAVSVNNFSTGTITNINGEFTLNLSDEADSLIISHLNYGKQTLVFNMNTNEIQTFYIKSKEILLEEVVVTNVSANKILFDAVKMSESNLTLPILLNTYYREFVKTDGKYTKFSDGLLNYYLLGTKKFKSEVAVLDSRAVELYDESKEEMDWDMTSPLDVGKVINVSKIGSIGRFLDEDNMEDYEYKLNTRKDKNGDTYKIINIVPKQGIEKSLYKARVVIDSKTGLILELEYELPDSHRQYAKEINILVVKAKILSVKVRIMFNYNKGDYHILYVLQDAGMRVWNKKSIDSKFRFVSDLIVTNVQKNNIQFDKKDGYKHKSLYKRSIPYKEEFWLNNNSVKLTDEEELIIKTLSNSANLKQP